MHTNMFNGQSYQSFDVSKLESKDKLKIASHTSTNITMRNNWAAQFTF